MAAGRKSGRDVPGDEGAGRVWSTGAGSHGPVTFRRLAGATRIETGTGEGTGGNVRDRTRGKAVCELMGKHRPTAIRFLSHQTLDPLPALGVPIGVGVDVLEAQYAEREEVPQELVLLAHVIVLVYQDTLRFKGE